MRHDHPELIERYLDWQFQLSRHGVTPYTIDLEFRLMHGLGWVFELLSNEPFLPSEEPGLEEVEEARA